MPQPMKNCPRRGCDRKRLPDQLLCKQCWYELPKHIRDEVWTAYRSRDFGERMTAARRALDALGPSNPSTSIMPSSNRHA